VAPVKKTFVNPAHYYHISFSGSPKESNSFCLFIWRIWVVNFLMRTTRFSVFPDISVWNWVVWEMSVLLITGGVVYFERILNCKVSVC
jgi:hypothetical protein